jgi:hypothetical protein
MRGGTPLFGGTVQIRNRLRYTGAFWEAFGSPACVRRAQGQAAHAGGLWNRACSPAAEAHIL